MKKRIIGLVLIFVSLGTLGVWEFWGREYLSYESILTFSGDVSRNTEIREDMLEIKMVETPTAGALGPEALNEIVGMEAIQFVPAGTELHMEYFQNPDFSIGGDTGKYILSIPNQWLMSYPQTLRRGDEVFFYCDGKVVTSATVAYARDSSNQEVISVDDGRLKATSAVSLVEVVVDEARALKLGKMADKGKRFVLLYC